MLLESVNGIKDKERLWRCSRLKEDKETWQLNVMPDPRLDPGLEFFFKTLKDIHYWVNFQKKKMNIDNRLDMSVYK